MLSLLTVRHSLEVNCIHKAVTSRESLEYNTRGIQVRKHVVIIYDVAPTLIWASAVMSVCLTAGNQTDMRTGETWL